MAIATVLVIGVLAILVPMPRAYVKRPPTVYHDNHNRKTLYSW